MLNSKIKSTSKTYINTNKPKSSRIRNYRNKGDERTTEKIKKLKTTEKQKENKMEQKFTISKLKEYISAIKTMGFDEESSEVRISDGIIYIDDKKNNKSATIVEKMLSITMYDTVINEKGEQNV